MNATIQLYFYTFITMLFINFPVDALRYPKVLYHSVSRSNKKVTREPIVILHGLLGSTRNFRSFVKILSQKLDHNHDIIVIDLNNHGRTNYLGEMSMNYPDMSIDVLHTLRNLNIHECHLLGHSMGGKTAALVSLINARINNRIISTQTTNDQLSSLTMKLKKLLYIKSLHILDICPTSYPNEEFETIYNTIQFIKTSQQRIQQAISRQEVISIIENEINDKTLQAFLITNIQEKNGQFSWKLGVTEIFQSRELIADFPLIQDNTMQYMGPTMILKGAKSNFVKSKYLNDIQLKFPNYVLVTQKEAGHWVHADQPHETADKIVQFIQYVDNLPVTATKS